MITAGIDVGSVAAKCILVDVSTRRIAGRAVLPSGWNAREAGEKALLGALREAGKERNDVQYIVGTGYGRVSLPFADKSVTEISCHARGAAHLFPATGVVLDIGGQDSKVIRLDAGDNSKGGGRVSDFIMNDKCAAGTGRFLQVLSGILGLTLEELGQAASRGKPAAISSMCAVFAETEIVGLLAKGEAPENIAAGVFLSIVRRTCSLARRIPVQGECTFAGGLALSPAFSSMLSVELGVPVNVPEDPQTMGALGAALIASDMASAAQSSRGSSTFA